MNVKFYYLTKCIRYSQSRKVLTIRLFEDSLSNLLHIIKNGETKARTTFI